MRQTAGKRPGSGKPVPDVLMSHGMAEGYAARVMQIAREFGVKAEAVPGGMVIVRYDGRNYTIEERT